MRSLRFDLMHAQDKLPDVLRTVSASVEVKGTQSAADGALTFQLRLDNAGPDAVAIKNPYDLLVYTITDSAGWPVALPAPSSKTGKVRGRVGDNRGHYLKVVAMRAGSRELDHAAEVVETALTVPARSHVVYDLAIERIAPPPNDANGPTTFGPGSYELTWQLLLLADAPADPAGATLVTGPVTVVMR